MDTAMNTITEEQAREARAARFQAGPLGAYQTPLGAERAARHMDRVATALAEQQALREAKQGTSAERYRARTRWRNMIERCYNSEATGFNRYGGRGITVDARWFSYDCFLEDMGMPPEGLWLDRRENDGPYTKTNCRWATPKEQAANRRPRSPVTDAARANLRAGQQRRRALAKNQSLIPQVS